MYISPFFDILLPMFLIMINGQSPNIKSSLEKFKHVFMTFYHNFLDFCTAFKEPLVIHPSALIPLLVLNKNVHDISILGHNTTSVFDNVLHSNMNNVCSPNTKSFLEEFEHAFMTYYHNFLDFCTPFKEPFVIPPPLPTHQIFP